MVAPSHAMAITIFFVYNALVAALVYFDISISSPPDKITVRRQVAPKLSISEKNDVVIYIANHSSQPIYVTLIDEYPADFQGGSREIQLRVERRSESQIKYQVVPSKRGDFFFGDIALRYGSFLELLQIQKTFKIPAKVEVYPNIKSIAKFELSVRRSHLIETGPRSERRRGIGTDFESLKEYVRGDEFRKMDWKATARRGKLITREYQSEVNQSVIVALDCSRAMGAKLENLTLLDYAINATLLLGYQVTRKEDKIGLITFSDQVHGFLQPKRGKRHFHLFLKTLYNLQPRRVEPNYELAFAYLMAMRVKRSLLLVITDLAAGDAAQRLRDDIWLISRKHLPVIISIMNPAVREAAFGDTLSLESAYRKVVALDAVDRVNRAKRSIETMGLVALSLKPAEICSSLLSNYLTMKLRSRI